MGYWQTRYEELEKARHDRSLKSIGQINKAFLQTEKQLSDKILVWYARLADNNGVSMKEAKRMLTQQELQEFKWTVEEYIEYGKKNGISGEWKKELENASARYHISRYESMMVQLRAEAEKCYQAYNNIASDHLGRIYEDSFYKSIFEMQKKAGVGSALERLNPDLIEKVIHKPWASDGKDFSDRIWQDKTKLVGSLGDHINRVCILGESPDTAIKKLSKDMQTSRSNASRLIMTETAYFGNLAERDSFDKLGVKEYEIVATLDSRTSEICQDMDGKHFPISDFKVGISAPPFHPNCRSCTCPYFDDEFELGGKRAARDENGEVYYVPQDMTYKDWKKSFVDGDVDYMSNSFQPRYGTEKEWKHVKFKTGTEDLQEYIDKKREQNFFGLPVDVTASWLRKDNEIGKVEDLQEYFVNGETFKVDGKKIVLDYSEHEKEIANIIAKETGKDIKMVPRIMFPQNIQTPDYLVDGVKFDLKTPLGNGKNTLYGMVKSKKKQANNFVICADKTALSIDDIEQQIQGIYSSRNTSFVDTIILVKNQNIVKIYKRNK